MPRDQEAEDHANAVETPSSVLSLRSRLLPFYQRWITGIFPARDFRSLVKKCATFSTMLITSRYVNNEHPYGFGNVFGGAFTGFEEKEEKEKDKKDKKDKDKKGKGKKDKKDKDKDKKGKDKKDKDKDKDKKNKKDKDKDKKDKNDKKDKDKDKKDKGKDKKEKETPKAKLRTVRDLLHRREDESISIFAPCMQFVKCPYGPGGEECSALKKAALSALNADRCWFTYMDQLSKCKDGNNCVKKLAALEQSCKNHAAQSEASAKQVLEK